MTEPLDLDAYIRRRVTVLATWAAWDEQPTNITRVRAHVAACVDYAGAAHVQFRQHVTAARRAGATYEQALEAWETDW